MIQVDAITVQLSGTPLLKELSLQVQPGEKIAISGESGSGKTTLLKTLIGWHRPISGNIKVDGEFLVPENLPAIRKKCFYLAQDVQSGSDDTVREWLSYPFQISVNKDLHFQEDATLTLFDAIKLKPDLLHRPMYELSGGEKKRVGLVRGLLLNRPLFLLDEPTSAVDADNRRAVLAHLLSLKNTTILAITHDEEFMAGANRHVHLEDGAIKEHP